MNLKLGLVRVAGYGIIAGSLCLKVCAWLLPFVTQTVATYST